MPRPPRHALAGVPQHVIQRGNNRQPTFFADRDYRCYLEHLGEAAHRHRCDVHAYVLMRNHVHLLVSPSEPSGIAKLMQALGRNYVREVNDRVGRTGTLWEGRYKASLIGSERYLFTCYRYIELNPVRAGIVPHPREYRWSSYRRNAEALWDPIVTEHAEYTALGSIPLERATVYRSLFDTELDRHALEELRHGRAFGSAAFLRHVESALRRPIGPKKPGRPRKFDSDPYFREI